MIFRWGAMLWWGAKMGRVLSQSPTPVAVPDCFFFLIGKPPTYIYLTLLFSNEHCVQTLTQSARCSFANSSEHVTNDFVKQLLSSIEVDLVDSLEVFNFDSMFWRK